jgi:hypothetical protein
MAGQLQNHQVVGMRLLEFPDNSVVNHARRLAGLWQDVFVTGAVLGVNASDQPLSYFPDIYNEDWFFFAHLAARRQLPHVGEATQAEYDPFAGPARARQEEFGDVLAEGLYALIGGERSDVPFPEMLRGATQRYWEHFIEARHDVLSETSSRLHGYLAQDGGDDRLRSAIRALDAAAEQLTRITPDLCVDFLEAWQLDLADWQRATSGANDVGSTLLAMDYLEMADWTMAEFGNADVSLAHVPHRPLSLTGA